MIGRRLSAVLWIVAFIITVMLAIFQRMTGPSYPLRGTTAASDVESFRYSLPRTHGGDGDLEVTVAVPEGVQRAALEWRRFPTDDPWTSVTMTRDARGRMTAVVPHQPPAGKVEYRLRLDDGGDGLVLPEGDAAVARFRADVPAWVLIPHILAMFGSMLVATRSLLEMLRPSAPPPRRAVLVAMVLLVVGGLILGPVVQKFAFGEYWTGWPLGHDLTDNKTLIAFLAWLPATVLAMRGRKLWAAVVVGWIVMMGVFLIPHSFRGSEMDWSEGEIKTGRLIGVVDPSSSV